MNRYAPGIQDVYQAWWFVVIAYVWKNARNMDKGGWAEDVGMNRPVIRFPNLRFGLLSNVLDWRPEKIYSEAELWM